jgi:hypothetical protein
MAGAEPAIVIQQRGAPGAVLALAKESEKQDDRQRNAEKPEKNATSHGDLL